MLNKKHLKMFKRTKEGDKFIDELLNQLIHEFDVINGKIIELRFKEYPVLDLDEIEMKVKKNEKGDLEMKELVQKVKQWGVNKGLHKVGHLAQAEYTLKEVAELLDAYADKDLPAINDAVGDILVTLIVGASNDDNCYRATEDLLSNDRIKFARTPSKSDELFGHSYSRLLNNVMQLEFLCEDDRMTSGTYACCINELNSVLKSVNFAFSQSLSLQDCLQLAYNEIKDRKGHTDENGHFIKED